MKEMASAAPVDKENVNRIKDAIKRSEYPIDLDQVSDALMEAYRNEKLAAQSTRCPATFWMLSFWYVSRGYSMR